LKKINVFMMMTTIRSETDTLIADVLVNTGVILFRWDVRVPAVVGARMMIINAEHASFGRCVGLSAAGRRS